MSVVPDVLTYLRGLGLTVYDGVPAGANGVRIDNPPLPYVCVYSDDGRRTSERLQGTPSRGDEQLRVISVGETAEQCRWVRSRAKSLAGQRFAGQLVEHVTAASARPDEELPGSLVSAYDMFSVPAFLTA